MIIKMFSYSFTMFLISATFSRECRLGTLLNNAVSAVAVVSMCLLLYAANKCTLKGFTNSTRAREDQTTAAGKTNEGESCCQFLGCW